MKKQRECCSPKDYDFYIIPFPLKVLPKEQGIKYLYSELSKLHPCFSDDCCFDYHLRLEKSGLKADVVVMQKIRLAELRNQKNQTRIYIEERKYDSFFKGDKKAWKLIAFFVLAALLILILSLCLIKNNNATAAGEIVPVVQDEKNQIPDESEYYCFVKDLFEQIKNAGGHIKAFEWKTDGFAEHLSVRLKGVYPEQLMLENLLPEFSSVSFENEMPVMTVVINNNFTGKGFYDSGKGSASAEVRALLRNKLCVLKVQILEETVLPYSLKLFFPDKQAALTDSLLIFFDFLNENNLSLDSLLISVEDNGVKLNCSFSSIFLYSSEPLCTTLGENLSLFLMPEKNTRLTQNPKVDALPKEKTNQKVGQMVLQNGQVVEFFKDQNGKIIRK